jgi:hypothetical protein
MACWDARTASTGSPTPLSQPLGTLGAAHIDANLTFLANLSCRDRLMFGINPPCPRWRGIRLNATITQLFREALPVTEKVIPVRMEAPAIMVAPRDGQVNVRMIAIDMQRGTHDRLANSSRAKSNAASRSRSGPSPQASKGSSKWKWPLCGGHRHPSPIPASPARGSACLGHHTAPPHRWCRARPVCPLHAQTADVGKVGQNMTTAMLAPVARTITSGTRRAVRSIAAMARPLTAA